ncbi:SDR family NAD(P)-dependent oxidoreductase [Paenibacillus sp. YYML68]|uniref:SDR family NAD(P)-dependent oxidoreductase n=1 Tax=Paenibacillus sp. YYML68 TaxID=2909250 RepID=UPI002492907C|nr:SDR family oxidoreductase [Paenibacillus sp. YYML68]
MTQSNSLAGKTAIVTGSGTGLGRAAAIALAAAGAHVVLVGRRANKLEETAAEIQTAGGSTLVVAADVSLENDAEAIVKKAVEAFGTIDILINNAAVFEAGQVAETTLSAWNEQIAVNLTGAFLMTREVIPHMRSQKRGHIINITSSMATNGAGGFAAYSASKAGLESLTRTTADDESSYHIMANLFNPGTVKSDMHATGKDPALVAPDIVALAALSNPGFTGRLVEAGTVLE